jgi:ribosomal protein S18 acetylase RimI-like enzyme
MPSGGLLARVFATVDGYLALGNEVIDSPLAGYVRNPEAPRVYDANHVTRVRAGTPKEINTVLERTEEMLSASGHRQFLIDPDTPLPFEARLALDGFEVSEELEMVLDGELPDVGGARGVALRPVASADDWASVEALMRLDHEEESQREHRAALSPEVTHQVVASKQFKAPAVQFFLASVKRTDCAYFSAWPGTNGLGKVEDLFTHPDFRHRGVATALLRHCVDDARARGARNVLIGARVDDTPKQMYAALGFRPVCVLRSWLRSA